MPVGHGGRAAPAAARRRPGRPGTSQPCATRAARSAATLGVGHRVGRVGEDHVVGRRRRGGQHGRRPCAATHVGRRAKPSVRGVARDQRGRAPVLLDQRHHAGAARPRLEADGAGAGVQVEEAQPVEGAAPRLDGGEQRLAHPVARGSGRLAAGRLEPAAARPIPR